MVKKRISFFLLFGLLTLLGRGQDLAYNDSKEVSYEKAFGLAYEGDHNSAQKMLVKVLDSKPNHNEARSLLASTYSWSTKYNKARNEFNKITSKDRSNRTAWISSVKNELYAKNGATALGLANKALLYIKNDAEILRLRDQALEAIKNKKYSKYKEDSDIVKKGTKSTAKAKAKKKQKGTKVASEEESKKETKKDGELNRISVRNAYTVYDQRYDPIVSTSVSYKRKTLAGSIIPKINYTNRLNKHGLQYDLDFYPKFSKRLYGFLNYGYSEATIFPNHKFAADLYINLPKAIEFSAGMRYLDYRSRKVTVISNSLGHYRGNYYFSLRSYITPLPNRLTRVSGNLLVRKYLRDGDNYFGATFGMGYSPKLLQLLDGDELLAETLLYIESQRLSFAYQFTRRKSKQNVYRTNLGIARRELTSDTGNFFWAVSAGLTVQVKF